MKTQSCKAKGRRLQQWFRDKLIEILGIDPQDIESRSMGASGEDIMLSKEARERFPYSVECKNVERVNIWEAYEQACNNCKEKYKPLLVIKRNHKDPLVVLDAEDFLYMWLWKQ